MTPEFPYVQLPGTFRGFFRKASLWEGVDHILSVRGTRFTEEYRRFYYRDIQAFILEKRARSGSIGWWVILLGLFVASLIAAAENDPHYSWIAALALAAIVAFRLDLTFRRSCRCSVQTAVSREPLPSLMRQSIAYSVIARLRERIASEQGELPEDIPPVEDEILAAIRRADSASPSPAAVLSEADRREQQRCALHGLSCALPAFLILLIDSVLTFWLASTRKEFSPALGNWIAYSTLLAELTPALLSLRYLEGIRFLKSLRKFMIAFIIIDATDFLIGATIGLYYATLRLQGLVDLQVILRYYNYGSGALQLVLAVVGLILVFAKWKTYRRGEPFSSSASS